ncbi:B12-binding domain-containing radical SAM protein [Candidatus Thorarchaeota archaeon]|nr:MAG: B12-binding domain-containing radical SAM protein [Candidatus Thorarchaeota archaeon]
MSNRILVIDALSAGTGIRRSSRDSIGCGPRTVCGVFEKHDIDCRIIRVEDVATKKNMLRKFDHLAISAMTMDFPAVSALVKFWRRSKKKGRIVLGGPIASDSSLLKDLNVELFVIGEGETTLEELILKGFFEEDIDLTKIDGCAFLLNNKIHVTRNRKLLSSEALSIEYHPSTTRIIDYQAYQASKVYVEVTRGCSNFRRTTLPTKDGYQCSDCGNCDSSDPHTRLNCPENIPPGCGFCSVPSTWGFPRSRSINTIVEEIRELVILGVHRIVLESPGFLDYMRGMEPLTDPCYPPANLTAIRELLEKINALPQVASKEVHIAIENMKACLFTEEVAGTLVKALPLTSPNIGLETGSEQHMREIGKCGSPSDVISAVAIAARYGMKPFVYFIYGLPGETPESVTESLNIMRAVSKAGAERIILYGFRALPGSAFEGYPDSKVKDDLGLILRQEADLINRQKKENYLGLVLRGVAAEPSWNSHGYTMIYPLAEGPLMTVHGGYSPGTLLSVRITKVLSGGLLEGEVVQNP